MFIILYEGIIPDHWRKYKVPKTVSLNHWVGDFKSRLQQVENITKENDYSSMHVWLGGLFMPEAYITATRQAVAQAHKWSLEELTLEIDLNKHGDDDSFTVTGNVKDINYLYSKLFLMNIYITYFHQKYIHTLGLKLAGM